MVSDPLREQAGILLGKARDDDYACRSLSVDEHASAWIVGFHAQQAVEKSIKAVLAARSVHYPFTHDIEALIKLLRQSGIPLPPDADNLPRLTPLGVLMRYEDELDDQPSPSMPADWIVSRSAQTINWAETQLRQTGA